jgi:hypothetical protein
MCLNIALYKQGESLSYLGEFGLLCGQLLPLVVDETNQVSVLSVIQYCLLAGIHFVLLEVLITTQQC